jgi:thiosulfate/3-mercaptopyruvate sulfurtransferase
VSEIALEELARRFRDVVVLDVRSRHEFDGSAGKPCDPRQGHIPGARNFDVYSLMEMTPEEVRSKLNLEPGTEIVSYCHSGSRSAIATQMLRSLGYDARNYVGSWHEWSRHDGLPVESEQHAGTS